MSGIWIRSQDGCRLMCFDGACLNGLDSRRVMGVSHTWHVDIGEYATEARAREVLDCIQRFIVSGMTTIDDGDRYSFEPNPRVFTMPKK